jgi:DNA replication protein DnaD
MNAYEDLKILNIDEILIEVIYVIIKELLVQINMNLSDEKELIYNIVEYQLNLGIQNQLDVYMSYHAYNVQKNEQYVLDR